jgi:hypothetical protein
MLWDILRSRLGPAVPLVVAGYFLVLVGEVIIFGGQAPRSVFRTRLCSAFRARLDRGLVCAHSTLQITRFLEAPMPSLFHHDSRPETCEYKRKFTPIPARHGITRAHQSGAGNLPP